MSKSIAKKWKVTAIIAILLVLLVIGICVAAAIYGHVNDVDFAKALVEMWPWVSKGAAETVPEVLPEAGEAAEEVIETVASVI